MADSRQAQGRAKRAGYRAAVVTIIVEMVETRLRLAIVELEGRSEPLSAFSDGRSSHHALRGVWLNEPDGSGHLDFIDPRVPLNAMIATTDCAVGALR